MYNQHLKRDVGERIHRLIAQTLTCGDTDVAAAARQLLDESPVPGTRATSVRCQLTSAVTVYRLRFGVPDSTLVGVEVPVPGAVADLVWARHGETWIDELKTGGVDRSDTQLRDQLRRLAHGGATTWINFSGVRLVALSRPRNSVWVPARQNAVSEPDQLCFTKLPDGLEVRS